MSFLLPSHLENDDCRPPLFVLTVIFLIIYFLSSPESTRNHKSSAMPELNPEEITFDSCFRNQELSQNSSTFIMAIASIFGIIVSSASGAFILLKLKLNFYMKIILGITVGINLLSSFSNLIAWALIWRSNNFSAWSYRLMAYSIMPLLGTINMLNSISILRS